MVPNETAHLKIGMGEVTCGWAGCSNGAEASVDGRRVCRNHFYDIAARRLEEHRARLKQVDPTGADRNAILKFLSEVINQTTALVTFAKFLGSSQRDQFLELSLSAIELHKRVQRNPRIPRNMPILVYREADSVESRELTSTVNVSKQGACITTTSLWKSGEKLWIEKPGNQLRALVRVAWVRKSEPSQFLMGLEILGCEDFWGLQPAAPKRRS
jgi:hypothetical protein